MDKPTQLLALAKARQAARRDGYGCIADYHYGVYPSRLLAAYLAVERAWLLTSHLPLPVGHTVICIARRQ